MATAPYIPAGPMRVTVGEALRILRRRHGMTLKQLERVSQVPSSTLSRIERDELHVPISSIIAAFASMEYYLQVEVMMPVAPAEEEE